MAHRLIVGQTLSGKTYFCNALASELKKQGKRVQIIDPVGAFDAPNLSESDFIDEVSQLETCPSYVFFDECGDYFSMSHRENFWIARRGRHEGWHITFITTRYNSVAPIVRDQCGEIFIFNVSRETAKDLARDFDINYNDIARLKTGDFIHIFKKDGVWKNKLARI